MNVLTAVLGMLTGGLSLEGMFSLFVAALAFMLVMSIRQYLTKLVAKRWVTKNQLLAIGSTWCRFGTSTGYFDAKLTAISTRSVQFRMWDTNAGKFTGTHRVPIEVFPAQALTILDTKPEGVPTKEVV